MGMNFKLEVYFLIFVAWLSTDSMQRNSKSRDK
jgi:hypothetical protein